MSEGQLTIEPHKSRFQSIKEGVGKLFGRKKPDVSAQVFQTLRKDLDRVDKQNNLKKSNKGEIPPFVQKSVSETSEQIAKQSKDFLGKIGASDNFTTFVEKRVERAKRGEEPLSLEKYCDETYDFRSRDTQERDSQRYVEQVKLLQSFVAKRVEEKGLTMDTETVAGLKTVFPKDYQGIMARYDEIKAQEIRENLSQESSPVQLATETAISVPTGDIESKQTETNTDGQPGSVPYIPPGSGGGFLQFPSSEEIQKSMAVGKEEAKNPAEAVVATSPSTQHRFMNKVSCQPNQKFLLIQMLFLTLKHQLLSKEKV